MMLGEILTTIGALLVGAMLLETLLYFAAPLLYSRAALVPLGRPRRIALDRAARDALAAPAPSVTGYRQSVAVGVDLTQLSMPPSLETSALVIHFDPQRRFAIGRLRYGTWGRALGVVRVDMTARDGAVELRSRFVAFGWPSTILAAPIAIAIVLVRAAAPAPLLAGGAAFLLLNAGLSWVMARTPLLAATAEIEAQLEQAIAQA